MTAAKIMDVIAGLPNCDGQAADAILAYTQVKLEDAPRLLKIPNSQCPDLWIRLPRHKWPKSLAIIDPVVPLERNLYGHPFAGFAVRETNRRSCQNLDGRKVQIGNVRSLIGNKLGIVTSKSEVILEAQRRAKNSPFCHTDGRMSSQECGVRQSLWRIIVESLYINALTDPRRMVLLRDRHAELKKELLQCCHNPVWTKNGGLILWNVTVTCRNVQDLLADGKTPYERRFGEPLKCPMILFLGAMVECYPRSAGDQSWLHQSGKTVLPGRFLGYAPIAERMWKGDVLVADIEELENLDVSEILEDSNAKW